MWKWIVWGGALWLLVSVLFVLVIGPILKRNAEHYPEVDSD